MNKYAVTLKDDGETITVEADAYSVGDDFFRFSRKDLCRPGGLGNQQWFVHALYATDSILSCVLQEQKGRVYSAAELEIYKRNTDIAS